jgi:WD40 repeat protein
MNFKNITSVRNHQSSVSNITRGDTIVASADNLGAVAVYGVNPNIAADGVDEKSLTIQCIVNISTATISSLLSSSNFLIAGLGNGKIMVLDFELNKRFEIDAHSRPVSGMDIDEENGLFCSCGEDSTLCVWSLPASEDDDIVLVLGDRVEDKMLTGCRFLVDGHDEHKLVCSVYDWDQLIVWKRVPDDGSDKTD